MSRILFAALVALALVPAAAQARRRRPRHSLRQPRHRHAEGRRRRRGRRRGQGPPGQPRARRRRGRRASSSSSSCARPARSTAASARAARSSPSLPGSSLDGVRALATFRDGRIVAAGTLARGRRRRRAWWRSGCCRAARSTRASAAGSDYVLAGPDDAELGAMVMDRAGNVILGGGTFQPGGGQVPVVIRLLPDGTPDPGFAGGTRRRQRTRSRRPRDGPARPPGRHGDLHRRPRPRRSGPATFTTVRLLPTGAPDPTFGGTGVVQVPLGPGAGAGIGAAAVRRGPSTTTLVAGTDLNASGTPRGSVIRLRADGTLDTRFGSRGIVRVARSGRDIRITSMVRDSLGRILLAGTGRAPDSLIVRLRAERRARPQLRQRRPDVSRCSAARRAATRSTRRSTAIDAAGSKRGPRRLVGRPGPAAPQRRPAPPTPAASRSPSRDCSNALVQPGHVRFVLGLHQHAAQHAHAVGVHLDARGARRRTRRASIRSVLR